MTNKEKELIESIAENPDLLEQTANQDFIRDLMIQLDRGENALVTQQENHLSINKQLIDVLALSIALRKYSDKAIPDEKDYTTLDKRIRRLPNSFIRYGSFISPDVVLMPFSLINMGAYIGTKTMIDGGARIGSGAYIGNKVHISGGVGIGGVLEPKQESPVIIEDDCFIGANSSISEGVHVGAGTVIAAGSIITGSTRIYDSRLGKRKQISKGVIPSGVVVIPSNYYASSSRLYRPCVEIIKNVENNRNKVINQNLR